MATTKIITEVTDLNAASSTNGLKMPTGGAYSGTPTDGMVRNDTTGSSQGSDSTMQHYNGIEWKDYENLTPPPTGFTADYLVVAGGGGGGNGGVVGSSSGGGGGAGAGGLRTSFGSTSGGGSTAESSLNLSIGTNYTVTVGSGGNGASSGTAATGSNGANSKFGPVGSEIESIGGGGGGGGASTGIATSGANGGSGGGGGADNLTAHSGGSGTIGQGYAGGDFPSSSTRYGAGGGGSSAAGSNGATASGTGGNGLAVSITGSSVTYAGGGGGGGNGAAGGTGGGGTGGVVSSTNPTNGTINTGGGSGGAANGQAGGSGGSGIVILRYPTADVSSYAVTGTLDTTADTAYPVANTAYYKLNGDVLDSSGNGYNGTFTTPAYAAGRFGQAAVFNGTSSNMTIPTGAASTGSDLSISMWLNPNSLGTQILADFGWTSSGNGLQVYFSSSALIFRVKEGSTTVFIHSATPPTTNNWQHLVFVWNNSSGGLSKVYINGSEDSSLPSSQSGALTLNTTVPYYIGNYGTSGEILNGSLDQIRIFNTALTAAQVTALYNEGTVVESTDGTDSILQFIGGTGTVTFS